jgi:putative transcriptional regulator
MSVAIGISETQLPLFRSGKVKGIRFRTLTKMCAVRECKPADLLDYAFDVDDMLIRESKQALLKLRLVRLHYT